MECKRIKKLLHQSVNACGTLFYLLNYADYIFFYNFSGAVSYLARFLLVCASMSLACLEPDSFRR